MMWYLGIILLWIISMTYFKNRAIAPDDADAFATADRVVLVDHQTFDEIVGQVHPDLDPSQFVNLIVVDDVAVIRLEP